MTLPANKLIKDALDAFAKQYGANAVLYAIKQWRQQKRTVGKPEARIHITLKQKEELYFKQQGRCAICLNPLDIKLMQVDHVVALAQGGKSEMRNYQLLHSDCNQQKSSKSLSQIAKESGKLITEQMQGAQ